MAMVICEECGKEYSVKASKCPSCGCPSKFITCSECGEKVSTKASTCPHCGCPISGSAAPGNSMPMAMPVINITNSNESKNDVRNEVKQEQSNVQVAGAFGAFIQGAPTGQLCNKWVSFILCILFGYFGAHKFYEGKKTMGIIYIFTMGIFGIGWVIDLIVLWRKPNPYYA